MMQTQRLEQETFAFVRSIKFASPSEAVCGLLLEKFLGIELIEGITYQKPLDSKHKADFFLPSLNIVLEFHPIVLNWGMKKENYTRWQRLKEGLAENVKQEIDLIFKSELLEHYIRRRQLFMDNSPDAQIKLARLIVVDSFESLYKNIIREHAKEQVKFDEFKHWVEVFYKQVKK